MLFFISGRSERRGRHAADNGITAIHAAELRAPEREAVAGGPEDGGRREVGRGSDGGSGLACFL